MNRPPISLFGFLAGLVTGLVICTAIALYLTNSPVPFVNKVQRSTENITPDAGDPNRSLFSPQIPGATPAEAGRPAAPVADTHEPATPPAGQAPAGAEAGDAGARLMLQVGAYKSADDADAVRARLALLGLDAKVTALQADGNTLYRVRLGPYGALDDLNGIKRTLSENGMEPQVVHVH